MCMKLFTLVCYGHIMYMVNTECLAKTKVHVRQCVKIPPCYISFLYHLVTFPFYDIYDGILELAKVNIPTQIHENMYNVYL